MLFGGASGKEPTCQGKKIRNSGSIPGQEDPLEEGMATHYSIRAWRILMDRGAWWATVHGVANSEHVTELT